MAKTATIGKPFWREYSPNDDHQPNHDPLRGPGFITSLLVSGAFLISIEGGERMSSSLSGPASDKYDIVQQDHGIGILTSM